MQEDDFEIPQPENVDFPSDTQETVKPKEIEKKENKRKMSLPSISLDKISSQHVLLFLGIILLFIIFMQIINKWDGRFFVEKPCHEISKIKGKYIILNRCSGDYKVLKVKRL